MSSTRKRASVVLNPMPDSNYVTPDLSKDLKKTIYEKKLLTTRSRRKIIDALEEIDSKKNDEQKKQKKRKIIAEILSSEETYLNQLDKIVTFFMKPVKEKKLLKDQDYDILFGNIKTIHNINKTLLKELKKQDVAKAFSNIAPFLKLYASHASNYKKCVKILQDCRNENAPFAKFLEGQESRPEVQSKLSALLITPIQRIPRYRLLLEELMNYTSPTDNEYASLKDSLKKVIDAANHINNVVEEHENVQRLLELQRCLKNGELNVITPGRKLIKDGILSKIPEKGGASEKLYIVLMNDIIMFCKVKKEELKLNSLKCSSIYPLNKCKVVEILDKGSFKIICQREETVLYNKQLSETKDWIKAIKDAIKACVDDRKTLRKESSARRPVKRKDLNEYHDAGLSPGKPLKKRRISHEITVTEEEPKNKRIPVLSKRRGIRDAGETIVLDKAEENKNVTSTPMVVESSEEAPEDADMQEEDEEFLETNGDSDEAVCKELALYNKPDNDTSLTAKVGSFFGGIGSSFRRLFGFR